MTKKLLIISSEYISSWMDKGEIVERYFNPGNLFDEVHLILLNNDKPDPKALQPMVGRAKPFIYNYPEPPGFFKKTLGWRPWLMNGWAKGAIEIARKINPHLIRCYGLHLNAFIGVKIKQALSVPLVTSLHGNPDVDYLRGRLARNIKDKIIGKCQGWLERFCLRYLDHVIAVYSPIESYLQKHNVKSYSVIHNVVGLGAPEKKIYTFQSKKIELICIGRQTYLQKDPSNIIQAIAPLQNLHLTLVGDGDLHESLKSLAQHLGCKSRITFIKSVNNQDLLHLMQGFDIYIYHSINYELSKSCIEAALVGLPIILNDRFGQPAQELKNAGFYLVKDSPETYQEGLEKLINDENFRRKLARSSHNYAKKNWSPKITEKKVANLYRYFLTS